MRLHHVVAGPEDGPVVVLSSSLGTTHAMWDPQTATLSERFRVVRYDRRGHGASPVPTGPYGMDDLGRDVLELLDAVGVERASFCGLSIGGAVGMWLALEAPERIDRLVLACTRPAFPPVDQWEERAATVRAAGVGAIADAVLARWFTEPFRAAHGDVADRYRAMLASTPAEGYAGCCEALASFDVTDRLGAIVAPTLVVTGAVDPVAPPEAGAALAAAIPGAVHATVQDAAHIANVEQPDAFTSLLLAHLTPGGAG